MACTSVRLAAPIFLSAPSARRATISSHGTQSDPYISIHALREEGDPFVRHSHKISVKHPKVSGEFEVSKVVSSTSENGFIRTKIYF